MVSVRSVVIGTVMSIDGDSHPSFLRSHTSAVLSESKHLTDALNTTERSDGSGSLTNGGFTPTIHPRVHLGASRADVDQDQLESSRYIQSLLLLRSPPPQDAVRYIILFSNTPANPTPADVTFATKWRVRTSTEIHKGSRPPEHGVFHPARWLIYPTDCGLGGRLRWLGWP